jgi:alginate O-acetyltransferase complex protein AlgI
MLFNSYIFIFIFLPITLGVFFIIGRRSHYRIALGWLVAASLFFYGYWNPIYLLLIGSSMTVNFQIGRWLNRSPDFLPICRRSLLITSITVNLTVLGFFKYANFIADQLSYVSELPLGLPEIVLPLGISFFTFQKIAYLVSGIPSFFTCERGVNRGMRPQVRLNRDSDVEQYGWRIAPRFFTVSRCPDLSGQCSG